MPSEFREQQLLDALWERVRDLIPPKPPHPKGGRPFASDYDCLAGLVYLLRNGGRWNSLPAGFPSDTTCWRRHRDWVNAGVWPRLHAAILHELQDAGLLDTSELAIDATFVEARKGGTTSARPSAASA